MPAIVGSSKLWWAYERMHTPPASISKRRPFVRGKPNQRVMKQLSDGELVRRMSVTLVTTACLPVLTANDAHGKQS